MKKLLRKLRDLDDDELAALQAAIQGELQRRDRAPAFVADELRFHVVGNDYIAEDDDHAEDPRRRTA